MRPGALAAVGSARLPPRTGVLRHSGHDVVPLSLSAVQGLVTAAILGGFLRAPTPALVAWFAVSLWWNANTVAHIHLHTPLFRSRRANRAFSAYLTVLTGIPQRYWARRHLWHHAGEPADRVPPLFDRRNAADLALVTLVVGGLGLAARPLLPVWLGGYAAGLVLCWLHGLGEHAGAPLASDPGVSCYGRLYNLLWLNDGYHAEHHRRPASHWTRLPALAVRGPVSRTSNLPPALRWWSSAPDLGNAIAAGLLARLEGLALRSRPLQAFLIDRHARATDKALAGTPLPPDPVVGVVGGGLFPRTVLVMQRRLPSARLVVLDASARHLEQAERFLRNGDQGARTVELLAERVELGEGARCGPRARSAGRPPSWARFDLMVFPLGLRGRRDELYVNPPAPVVLVHDWLWRRRGDKSVVVSPWLLKRLNLVTSG